MTLRSLLMVLLASACAAWGAAPYIIVYGGTSAGVMAAVQAARMGQPVMLIAPEKHIGGIAVDGLGSADINNHWFKNDVALGGLAKEFYTRIGAKYKQSGPVYRYESHIAEEVFDDLLKDARVIAVRQKRLREPLSSAVEWHPGTKRLRAIVMESGERYEAAEFIDATIEGDLIAAAGVDFTWGREANAQYGETKNGIRAETTHAQFKVRVDPYRIPGNPSSGLIPTIQNEPLGTPGDGDKNIQAFCFRLCLIKNPANRLPIAKPKDFNRDLYEIYFRYVKAGGTLWTPDGKLPNGKTDLGSWHDLSANLYGMNRDYPNGNYQARQRIYQEHLSFTHGLLWLLTNDPEIPEATRAAWRQWGLPKDEFTDNGGWPRSLYIRDARRMISDLVLTEHHTRRVNPEPVADPVTLAFWPTDTHSVRRIVRNGAAYNEGFVFDDNNWGPFGVAYRALVPKRLQATNLITPTCVSSSHVAYGAIRLEQTFMSLGQAAATAAVLAVRNSTDIQDVAYPQLRQQLLRNGQVLSVALVEPQENAKR